MCHHNIILWNEPSLVFMDTWTVESLINTRTRNVAALLRAQRSSRHKNCRIGGLMFDNQRT